MVPLSQFMFVQTADRLQIDGPTLRLANVGSQNLCFSDRRSEQLRGRPPHATIPVSDKAAKANTLVVVEISQPKLAGRDLLCRYRLIEGAMLRGDGATALFIDWTGVSGGVGPGFHGVGVGCRGVGWR